MGVRELRNNVAAVLRRAAAGERVVVTVDGRPVAMLGPLAPDPASGVSLDDLTAAGLVEPAARTDRPAAPDAVTLPVDTRAARALSDVRGGG